MAGKRVLLPLTQRLPGKLPRPPPCADYMLIGGYAVMAHGYIRATQDPQDLDVWVRPTSANAARVMAALVEFGLPPGLSEEQLLLSTAKPPTGFRFGRPPFAVDLITSVQGVEFG